ncbi:MAG TPA: AMP-binding protein [Thermoanaerobaculia bacterium]
MFISRLLPRVASIVPANVALKQGRRCVTYGELADQAGRLARAFTDLGIAAGDRVALLGHPGIDLVIAEHAAVAIGAIPFGIYSTLAPREIQEIIDDAAPSVVVVDEAFETFAAQLVHARAPLEVSCRPRGVGVSMDELIASSAPLAEWHEAGLDDPVLLVYTGGTSGRPKGVTHTAASVSSWVNMNHPAGPAYAPHQRSIVFNLAHLSGQANLWKTVAAGGRLVFFPSYPPAGGTALVDLLEAERITNIGTVGGTFSDILNTPDLGRRDLRSLQLIAVGGSFTSAHVLQRATELLPSAMIMCVYSLTESGQLISALSVNDAVRRGRLERLRSVGVPGVSLFGQKPFAVRVVDDAGRDVEPGGVGEILVAGPQLMSGYWKNEEATRRTLAGGWLHTGDVGRIDADGYLYLLDRKRDIIISRTGVNVYTSEVEDAIARHPAVQEVAILGNRAEDAAEEIAAAVVLREGTSLTLPELHRFCADSIAAFKMPSHLTVLDALPRTDVGKIDKLRLRAALAPATTS